MIVINRRAVSFAALILIAAGLTACGDKEPDQRKAFIAFPQEVNQRTGVHFLTPKPAEVKAFGDYARHYAVIVDYGTTTRDASGDFLVRLSKLGYGPGATQRTIEQLAVNPKELEVVRDENAKILQAIEARLAKVNAERNALKQPDDLKAVYDLRQTGDGSHARA